MEKLLEIRNGLSGHGGRERHPGDLHITLAFLGRVLPEQQACVFRAADRVRCNPFELIIDRAELWRRPGILWCGPTRIPGELQQLVSSLQKGLVRCGFEPDARPYTPHITLARKSRTLPAGAEIQPLSWHIKEFALVGSNSGIEPPRYRIIKKWSMDS